MSRIRVVLHRPIYPRNIGMCARAMANMGLTELIVIAPRCELDVVAKQGAAHAQAVLREARVFASQKDYLAAEGSGLRIALSGKAGLTQPLQSLEAALSEMALQEDHAFRDTSVPIHLMFGPEDDGLSQEEMELCHAICRLPTFGEITSLNLSHAVLLTSYIVQTALGLKSDSPAAARRESVTRQPAFYPSESIRRWLTALGFDLSAPKKNVEKKLNRIFLSHAPDEEELRLLDTVLQQTIRKLESPKP